MLQMYISISHYITSDVMRAEEYTDEGPYGADLHHEYIIKEEELRMMKADMAKWVESLLMLRMRM